MRCWDFVGSCIQTCCYIYIFIITERCKVVAQVSCRFCQYGSPVCVGRRDRHRPRRPRWGRRVRVHVARRSRRRTCRAAYLLEALWQIASDLREPDRVVRESRGRRGRHACKNGAPPVAGRVARIHASSTGRSTSTSRPSMSGTRWGSRHTGSTTEPARSRS